MELLFVAAERSSTVAVYDIADKAAPELVQFLPAVMGPESVVPLAARNLVVIANEVDDEARSMVNIYQWEELSEDGPDYPSVVSADEPNGGPAATFNGEGLPIPFGALSGLTAGETRRVSVRCTR